MTNRLTADSLRRLALALAVATAFSFVGVDQTKGVRAQQACARFEKILHRGKSIGDSISPYVSVFSQGRRNAEKKARRRLLLFGHDRLESIPPSSVAVSAHLDYLGREPALPEAETHIDAPFDVEVRECSLAEVRLGLFRGVLLAIARQLRIVVETPTVKAVPRKTLYQLTVAVDGSTVVLVIAGELEIATAHGSVVLRRFEQSSVPPGGAPSVPKLLSGDDVRRRVAWVALPEAIRVASLAELRAALADVRTIVIYSAIDDSIAREIISEFTKRTGISAELILTAPAGTIGARLFAERTKPRADLILGGSADSYLPLAERNLLAGYKAPLVQGAKIRQELADPEGFWHGWQLSILAIVINKEVYSRKFAGISAPKTWDDLLNPAYRGQIAIPNPVTAGTGYRFLATQLFRFGRDEERAFGFLKELSPNVGQYTATAPAALDLVAKGEAVMTVALTTPALQLRDQGAPIEIITPPDTSYDIVAAGIVKGGPNPDGSRHFINFLLTREVQAKSAAFGLYPVRPDSPSPPGLPLLRQLKFVRYDSRYAAQNRASLLERWRRDVAR